MSNSRVCPFCTFENENIVADCAICHNIIAYRCSSCSSLNDINAIKCIVCNLYLDKKKNKKCKACGRLNREEEEKCIECKVSFTCPCNKCKIQRKEIKMEDIIEIFVKKFTDYADEKKISYEYKKLFLILNITFNIPIEDSMLYFRAYSRIINYVIMDTQEQKIFIKDNFDDEKITYNDVLTSYQQIIIPYLRTYLVDNMIDVSVIEEKLIENETLNKQSRPKPVSEKIMDKLNQLEKTDMKHECFCADEANIKEVILLPCCKKKVHLSCMIKWFKLKDKCPYCNTLNSGLLSKPKS